MASDTTTASMRRATAQEINAYLEELVVIGNRMVGDRYIFGGTETTDPPLQLVGGKYVMYNGNEDDIRIQTDRYSFVPINATAHGVFGSLVTVQRSGILEPRINLDQDRSTRLEDLNKGDGVTEGSIQLFYSGAPINGIEIDMRNADTLEDVNDIIEQATGGVVTVSANTTNTGITLTDTGGGPVRVEEVANNTTARDLGIRGTVAGAVLTGNDVNAILDERTLLADIPGYYGTPLTITTGSQNLKDPRILERSDINNNLSNYSFTGLDLGKNTDPQGYLYMELDDGGGGGPYTLNVYKNSSKAPEDLVATGTTASPSSSITLSPANSSGLAGTVDLTFVATDNNLEVEVEFPDAYQGTVHVEAFQESNDQLEQLKSWQLYGIKRGTDTGPEGEMHVRIDTVGAQRRVRIYQHATDAAADANAIAEGFLPVGVDNGNVSISGIGTHAHISGSVNLEYLQDDADIELKATFASVQDFINAVDASETYTTARLSDDGRSVQIMSRLAGATLHIADEGPVISESGDVNDEIQRWDIHGIKKNVNTDSEGKLYAEFTRTAGAPWDYNIDLYKDAAHTELVASGTAPQPGVWPPAVPNELNITIAEAPGSDSGISGSVKISNWTADATNIVLDPEGIDLSGERREDNLFSTMNDVIESALDNDSGTLHDLIGNFDVDNNRVLASRANIGTRMERFELLRNRLADEKTSFSNIFANRIDLDFASAVVDFQAQSNIFNASLSVAGRIVPMSLVDYI